MTVPLELRPDTPGSDIDGMQFEFAPDLSLGRRLAFAYEHLSSSLYEGDPEAVIMSRLADLLQAEVTVYGADLTVIRSSVRSPSDVARRLVEDRPRDPRSRSTPEWGAQLAPIGKQARHGWLVACRRRGWGNESRNLVRMIVGSTAPLIAAVRQLEQIERDGRTAYRQALVRRLMQRRPARDRAEEESLSAQAVAAGLDRGQPTRAVVARIAASERQDTELLLGCVEEALSAAGLRHLIVATEEGELIGLAQGSGSAIGLALDPLPGFWPELVIGIGREIVEFALVCESKRDAIVAIDQVLRDGGSAVMSFEELDLGGLIATESAGSRVGLRLRSLIEDLRSDPLAYDALVAFLRNQQSVSAARCDADLTAGALGRLLAVAEAYPDLKANTTFLEFQAALQNVEDEIQLSRRYYNGATRNLNTSVESFPQNVVANAFKFEKAEYFELENEADRAVPNVKF